MRIPDAHRAQKQYADHGAGWLQLRRCSFGQRDKAWLAVGIFALAITAASTGLVYLPVALGAVVAVYVLLDIVPIRSVYDSVEWPVIVLLGAMIPIGGALQATGGTSLIADGIVSLSEGASPVVVLTLLVIIYM